MHSRPNNACSESGMLVSFKACLVSGVVHLRAQRGMLIGVWSIACVSPMLTMTRTMSRTCLKQWHVMSTSFSARSFCSAPQSTTGFRVCVVGSGPAGFYTTDRVIPLSVTQKLPSSIDQLLCSHFAPAAIESLRTSHQRRFTGNTVTSVDRKPVFWCPMHSTSPKPCQLAGPLANSVWFGAIRSCA